MVNSELEEKIKKSEQKFRRSTEEEKKEVFNYLNERLLEKGLDGRVVSLLVKDARKVNCYGQRIDPNRIFGKLNLFVGVEGSRLIGRISYPEIHRLTSYQSGYFVPGEEFGLKKQLNGLKTT